MGQFTDPETLQALHTQALTLGSALEVSVAAFDAKELVRFGRSFEKQFVLHYAQRPEIADHYRAHIVDILVAALVAKDRAEFKTFGGARPEAAQYGMQKIRAGFYGVGDDWDDIGSITTGAVQSWIHSGTTLLGGSSGNAILISRRQGSVVTGFVDLHPAPAIESIKVTKNGEETAVEYVGESFRMSNGNGGLSIHDLDTAYLFPPDTTVLMQIFASAQFGATVSSIPKLLGASFIPQRQLRIQDPASLVGTTQRVVETT